MLSQYPKDNWGSYNNEMECLWGVKLKGELKEYWRYRVGDYRILSKIIDNELTEGKIVYTRGRTKNENQDYYASKKGDEWLEGDMVVLVNQYSASASEILSGALQDSGRAKLLGETTFGKFSVQYVLPLDTRDNTSFKFTVAHYYTPNGRRLHGKGLTPDFVVVEPKLNN